MPYNFYSIALLGYVLCRIDYPYLLPYSVVEGRYIGCVRNVAVERWRMLAILSYDVNT